MSIIIKRVEISNIQVHKHFVFTPDDEGITAIRGANGTGKSTIVDSIAWALYGIKPPEVKRTIDLFNEDSNFPDDKCFVKVDLIVDGRNLSIERKMLDKKGKTECDVIESFIDDDKTEQKHQAGPAVSHAEPYIRKALKMDKNGFLTAILIQQKQVDKLVLAKSNERAQIIEKLTGISSISNALTEARQEYNTVNRLVKSSSVDEKELEKNINNKKDLEQTIEKLRIKVGKQKEEALSAKKIAEDLNSQVEEEYSKIKKNEENRTRLETLNARIETFEENLEEITVEKEEKKKQLSLVIAGSNIEELESQLKQLRRDLRDKEILHKESINNIEKSEIKLEEYNELINKSSIKTVTEAESGKEKADAKLIQLNEKISTNSDEIIASKTEIKKLERAIKVLSEKDGTCPTCLQHVNDVSFAVESLNAQKEQFITLIDSKEKEHSSLESAVEKSQSIIEKFNILIEALTNKDEIIENVQQSSLERDESKASILTLEAEIEAISKLHNEAKNHEETKASYDRLVSRTKKIVEEINTMKGSFNNIEKEIKNSGSITDTALEKMRKKQYDAQEKFSSLSVKYSELAGDLRVSNEQIKNIELVISQQEKEIKEYKSLLNKVELAKATVKVIEEFKEDRIRNSVPIIESYASDLLSRFTEGKFTGIKMDSKFNASVVLANGKIRSVGSLSGGELSLTSIALLISISMLLNGSGSKNPIILDEVFVSQDANRAELSITTIKEVCKGQVIMIAHNESLDAVADKVVELM